MKWYERLWLIPVTAWIFFCAAGGAIGLFLSRRKKGGDDD